MQLFMPKAPRMPAAVAAPTKANTAEAAEAARQDEALKQAKRRGRGRDMLTGAGGVPEKPPTLRKQILGA